jgi:hypothetical protein
MATRPLNEIDSFLLPMLPELEVRRFNWQAWLSGLLSLGFVVTIIWKIKDFGFAEAINTLPASPVFWFAFAGYYLALPSSEWLIFRRLWRLPASGFIALLRKMVSNEVLLGYSGEAYFYTWARKHAELVTAPFGAIKDVSILSALAGNLITLVMMVAAWPLVGTVAPQFHARAVLLSAALIIGMSMIVLLFRSRIFSLQKPQLKGIFGVHIVRLVVTTILSGIMWHAALPDISLVWLILLATLQLLVTRLPFVPNKELVFASLAIFLIGNDGTVATLIAVIASCILATHLVVGGVLMCADLIKVAKG